MEPHVLEGLSPLGACVHTKCFSNDGRCYLSCRLLTLLTSENWDESLTTLERNATGIVIFNDSKDTHKLASFPLARRMREPLSFDEAMQRMRAQSAICKCLPLSGNLL
jgi:hypothetical protein